MLRYKLRTLMIVLAIGPPVLAGVVWLISTVVQITGQRFASESPSPYSFLVITGGGIGPATNVELRWAIKAAHQKTEDDSDSLVQ